MKKTAVLLILSWIQYIYSPVSAQVFQGTPPAEWIEVSGEASIKLPQEEKLEHQELLRLAQQTAIENQFGTSIVYGNFMKTYESELQHYEHFVDMKSQFAQGVWCSDKTEPVFTSRKTEILGADRKGNFKKKIPAVEWTCAVNGYAKQLHQILPRFEFKILNDKKNVVVEQKIGLNGSELIAGQDSVFHQGDLFITQFRSSKSGHLALFMDNGEKAQRMLPYYAYDNVDDVSVKANQWYSFFDISEPSGFPKENIDELELITDQKYDVIRIYYLFSETPFTKDFFFSSADDEGISHPELPKGYSELPSVTSQQFVQWLQANRIRKKDLQITIVDLIIDNH